MVSQNSFRVMGYIYAGLCLVGSLLLIINSSLMVKSTSTQRIGTSMRSYDVYSNESITTSSVNVTSVVTLIISLISIIFDILLIFGMIMRRVNFVQYHLRYLTTIYILLVIGLFVGCIVAGIAVGGGESWYNNGETISAAVISITCLFIVEIIVITLYYTLISWILNGVIGVIKHDIVMLISPEAREII